MYAMAYTTQFSEWLTAVLFQKGISQSELARQAGVTRGAINGVLTGARGPGVDLCNGIARALKIPPEEVLRAAGLLPPLPNKDDKFNRIESLYHSLQDEINKQKVIEFLEFLSHQEGSNDKKSRAVKR